MNLIDKRQLDRGILDDAQSEIDGLNLLSPTGGTISGNLYISGDIISTGSFNSLSGLIFVEETSRIGVNKQPSSNFHLFNESGGAIAAIESTTGRSFVNLTSNAKDFEASIGISTGTGDFTGQIPDSLFLNSTHPVSLEIGGSQVAIFSGDATSFDEKVELSGQSIIDGIVYSISGQTLLDSINKTGFLSSYYGFCLHGDSGVKNGELFLSWNHYSDLFYTGINYNGYTGNEPEVSFSVDFSGNYINLYGSGSATGLTFSAVKYCPSAPTGTDLLYFDGVEQTKIDLGSGFDELYSGNFGVSLFFNTTTSGVRQDILSNNNTISQGELAGVGWNLGIDENNKLFLTASDGTSFSIGDFLVKPNKTYNAIFNKVDGVSELWIAYYESSASSSSSKSSSSSSSSRSSRSSSSSSKSSSSSSVESSSSSNSSRSSSSSSNSSRSSSSSSRSSSSSSSSSKSSSSSSSSAEQICQYLYVTTSGSNPPIRGAYVLQSVPSDYCDADMTFRGIGSNSEYVIQQSPWFNNGEWLLFNFVQYGCQNINETEWIINTDYQPASSGWTCMSPFSDVFSVNGMCSPTVTCQGALYSIDNSDGADGLYSFEEDISEYQTFAGRFDMVYRGQGGASDWVMTYKTNTWTLFNWTLYGETSPTNYYRKITSNPDPTVGSWSELPNGWTILDNPTVTWESN